MLETILNSQLIYIGIGVAGVIGIVSKAIAQITLKRLVKAASNMNKSNHPLMRLVRAKFEHACMVSDKVENVPAFVEKYLYEYRVAWMKLHTWQRLEINAVWLSILIGAMGAGVSFYIDGMQDQVIQYGAMGAAGAILLFIIHKATDESYRMNAAKVYMVDYLENVCAHRYAKAYHSDERHREEPQLQEEEEADVDADEDFEEQLQAELAATLAFQPLESDLGQKEPLKEPDKNPAKEPITEPAGGAVVKEPTPPEVAREEPEQERIPRETVIREILEEFLA